MQNTAISYILFSIATPGQLINSLSIIGELDKGGSSFHYYLLDFCKGDTFKDFNFPDSKYSIIRVENREENLLGSLAPILEISFDRVFIYLEQFIENAFLAKHFKTRGATICLGNDGNRPYYKINRLALKSRVTETYKFYKTAFKNRLPSLPNYIYNLEYGNLKYIDEYWMPFPMKREWVHIKTPIILYQLLNEEAIGIIRNSFMRLEEVENPPFPHDGIIFYMNNILYRDKTYQAEIDALKEIKDNNRLPLVIKMHPATPLTQCNQFKETGDYVFQNSIPAEVYMMEMRDTIFLSGWSSSLLYDNQQNCKYYWLYSYMVAQGFPIKDLVDFTLPDTHIEHPTQLKEISLR